MPVSDMVDPHVADYQQWLKRHRGITITSKRGEHPADFRLQHLQFPRRSGRRESL
jgi:hypothetical protein